MTSEMKPVTQSNSYNTIKYICAWVGGTSQRTENGKQISSVIALSRNIEKIHMAVLDITQYELVPATEFPGNTHYI